MSGVLGAIDGHLGDILDVIGKIFVRGAVSGDKLKACCVKAGDELGDGCRKARADFGKLTALVDGGQRVAARLKSRGIKRDRCGAAGVACKRFNILAVDLVFHIKALGQGDICLDGGVGAIK